MMMMAINRLLEYNLALINMGWDRFILNMCSIVCISKRDHDNDDAVDGRNYYNLDLNSTLSAKLRTANWKMFNCGVTSGCISNCVRRRNLLCIKVLTRGYLPLFMIL